MRRKDNIERLSCMKKMKHQTKSGLNHTRKHEIVTISRLCQRVAEAILCKKRGRTKFPNKDAVSWLDDSRSRFRDLGSLPCGALVFRQTSHVEKILIIERMSRNSLENERMPRLSRSFWDIKVQPWGQSREFETDSHYKLQLFFTRKT